MRDGMQARVQHFVKHMGPMRWAARTFENAINHVHLQFEHVAVDIMQKCLEIERVVAEVREE